MNRTKLCLILLFALAPAAECLTVMTYNIRLDVESDGDNDWAHRKDFFASQLRFYSPDIFGVQEALPNQVTDISASLPRYGYVGAGRDEDGQGEASDIYYKKDVFSVIVSSTFWLSETPEKVSKGWDAGYRRVCTYALLKDLKTGKSFWVFNTHLDNSGEEARTRGIRLILSKIAGLNAKKLPVIFMGDLNSEPKESRIIELSKEMNDAREVSEEKPFGPAATFNGFKYDTAPAELIDYVFVSKGSGMKVKKYAVLTDSKDQRYPSDHFPVYVEIYYK